MDAKTCKCCGDEKPLGAFRSGRNKCLMCEREYDRDRYRNNPDRRRYIYESCSRTWTERSIAWSDANPLKKKAHYVVRNAVRRGELVRGECERSCEGGCRGPVQFHHDDYSKPMDVMRLCVAHHAQRHVELREQALREVEEALAKSNERGSNEKPPACETGGGADGKALEVVHGRRRYRT